MDLLLRQESAGFAQAVRPVSCPPPAPMWRLPAGPSVLRLCERSAAPAIVSAVCAAQGGVRLQPIVRGKSQPRLLVAFPVGSSPQVNGEPAPRLAVLSAGDFFQWAPGCAFRVVLFSRPQVGPPSAALLGKPCPVCRVPFLATSSCYSCLCGVVLHCEAGVEGGLQCAQLRRDCPVCSRPIVLSEAFVGLPPHED